MWNVLVGVSLVMVMVMDVVHPTCHVHWRGLTVADVIDGDTVRIHAPFLPYPLNTTLSLRIRGVDCPESGHRARCSLEALRATAATVFTTEQILFVKPRDIGVELCDWDKYGGRVLGDLLWVSRIDDQDHECRLSSLLLAAHHAVVYYGRNPKHDWCTLDQDTCE